MQIFNVGRVLALNNLPARPAHVTVSWDRKPERAPLPYWMAKLVPLATCVELRGQGLAAVPFPAQLEPLCP